MIKLRERYESRIIFIVGLSIVLSVLGGLYLKTGNAAQGNEETAVRDALMKSAVSFEKNDLAMASQVWANDESLTIFESGHANYGWADYRDHHLVPEMGEMKNTKYAFSDIKISPGGQDCLGNVQIHNLGGGPGQWKDTSHRWRRAGNSGA